MQKLRFQSMEAKIFFLQFETQFEFIEFISIRMKQ